MRLLNYTLLGATLLLTSISSAASFTLAKGAGFKLEPLYGLETVYRDYPSSHLSTHTMYGARLSYGADILSGELEYTKSSDTEDYSTAPETVKYEDQKAKLGIRSTFNFNNYFFASGRLGAQATKEVRESTSGGVTTRDDRDIEYHPYAGASLGIRLGVISLNVNSTVVFRDGSDMSKNDYQNTFSVGVGY